jgi:hypothetical protein
MNHFVIKRAIIKGVTVILGLILMVNFASAYNTMHDSYSFTIETTECWNLISIINASTLSPSGYSEPFNLSAEWKIEYTYTSTNNDHCFNIITRDQNGMLISFFYFRDSVKSSGTFYGYGERESAYLNIFAGLITEWEVRVYTRNIHETKEIVDKDIWADSNFNIVANFKNNSNAYQHFKSIEDFEEMEKLWRRYN